MECQREGGTSVKDILLVEDHAELNQLMRAFLSDAGYQVMGAASGEEALALLEQERVKLVILDVSLPGMDGFAVCQTIRERSGVPLLFLSARVDKEDKMNGYRLGADDYVEKPVDMDILLAKVSALLYRNYACREKNALLQSGSLTIDTDAKRVQCGEKEIPLGVKEYELLLLLVKNAGKVLHKEFLFNEIWGVDSFSENQTLTVHIKMLRDKIEEDPKKPRRIRTVWGVGYIYEEI